MKICIKIFRIFEKQSNFEIKPLTILVGPNNSGKSSFTKFLMLLRNGYNYLNFNKNDDHNLSSYDKELNRDSRSDELQLSFSISDELWLSQQAEGSITYFEGGKIKNGFIFNKLISFELDEEYYDSRNVINNIPSYSMTINTQEFIDFIKSSIIGVLEKENKTFKGDLFDFDLIKSVKKEFNSKYDIEEVYNLEGISNLYNLLLISELHHELNKIEHPYFFYEVYINGVLDVKNQNIENIQTSNLSSGFDFHYGGWNLDHILFYKFFNPSKILEKLKNALEKKFEGIIESDKIEIKPSKLHHILFDKTFPFPISDLGFGISFISFSELIFRNIFNDLNRLSKNIYIPAKRGAQERYFKKSDFVFEIINKYNYIKKGNNYLEDFFYDEEINFRKSLIELFDLEGEIIVKEFENLQAAYIKKGDQEENLSDLGLGFSQLVPLILFFHNLTRFDKSYTIIIEEPEANLHPALQSKLADFFTLVVKTFPGIHLIVETHSEYMIRKLQFLVANGEMHSDNCLIHYFNSKQNSVCEGKVKTIEILDNGMLSDHFGTGFFDEVSLLQIELMNLIKQRLN